MNKPNYIYKKNSPFIVCVCARAHVYAGIILSKNLVQVIERARNFRHSSEVKRSFVRVQFGQPQSNSIRLYSLQKGHKERKKVKGSFKTFALLKAMPSYRKLIASEVFRSIPKIFKTDRVAS